MPADDRLGHLAADSRPVAEIVEKEQRLGALHEDVVDAVVHEIDAHRVVPAGHERDLELRADAVGAGHQHRIAETARLEPEQPAERPDVRQHARA